MALNQSKNLEQQDIYTYGIEMELILAFEESLVEIYLDDGEIIAKNLPEEVRDQPPFNRLLPGTDRLYNSWGIASRNTFKPYSDQPLMIAEKILTKNLQGTLFEVYTEALDNQKHKSRYHNWHITSDPSVPGVGCDGLVKHLADRIKENEKSNWDSYGIEVVSPVFNTLNNSGFDAIKNIISSLKGTSVSPHGAFITNNAGLHVHVGAPDSLEELKHLAYLTVIYEDEINRLHPSHRNPGHKDASWIQSNRGSFIQTPASTIEEHGLTTPPTTPPLAARDENNTITSTQGDKILDSDSIRDKIWETSTLEELRDLMCPNGRNYLVNWQHIIHRGDSYPRTVEFRQHAGSLDAEAIEYWVFFVVGLLRIAKIRAQAWETCDEEVKLDMEAMDMIPDIEMLWEWMEMPEEARKFLREANQGKCLRWQDICSRGGQNDVCVWTW